MAQVIDGEYVPTCNKKKRRCLFDCDLCGVDYAQTDDDDAEADDDGFGTHW